MGYIYMIYNTINDKVYIGQTVHDVEIRMKQHIYLSRYGNSKLYKAMRDLGADNFRITTLVICDNANLTINEALEIERYNSICNGYNSVMPTTRVKTYDLHELYGDELLDDYMSGMTYNDIGVKYNISRKVVSELCSHLSSFRQNIVRYNFNSVPVVMYDTSFEPIGKFETIKDAGKWLSKNTNYSIEPRNLYNYINGACKKGNIAYGHHWQYLDKLRADGRIFRSVFDIINYVNGDEYKERNGITYCGNINKHIHIGGWKKSDETEVAVKKLKKVNKLDAIRDNRNLAIELVHKYSYAQIADMFGCTPNAVKKCYIKLGLVKET